MRVSWGACSAGTTASARPTVRSIAFLDDEMVAGRIPERWRTNLRDGGAPVRWSPNRDRASAGFDVAHVFWGGLRVLHRNADSTGQKRGVPRGAMRASRRITNLVCAHSRTAISRLRLCTRPTFDVVHERWPWSTFSSDGSDQHSDARALFGRTPVLQEVVIGAVPSIQKRHRRTRKLLEPARVVCDASRQGTTVARASHRAPPARALGCPQMWILAASGPSRASFRRVLEFPWN